MKNIINLFVVLCLILSFTSVYAAEIVLPDGRKLNIDNLSRNEINEAISTSIKSMPKSTGVIDIVNEVNPNNLEAWSKLITGTIKTVCQDLSITVNDFVKTPVAMGISALIIYKVAGKDLLDNALDIIIMVPLWFIMTGIILLLSWYFYSSKTYYNKIYFDEKGKKVKEGLIKETRFKWEEPAKRDEFPAKLALAIVLIVCQILGTLLTILIVLT